jgi:phospholipase/carboxylesterase
MPVSRGTWGGLEVVVMPAAGQAERGGDAVVLLHGWGASGDDLVPLAEALARPGARFIVPAAPLAELGGGRAWWHLDPGLRPEHAWDDVLRAGHVAHPEVLAARVALQALLGEIVLRHAPDRIMLAGFSQGAMLALDVALVADPAVDRVAALSGVLLADSLPALHAPRARRPAVLVAHGRHDRVLAFAGGEHAQRILREHAFDVTWLPFDGAHEIPPALIDALDAFLFAA